MAANFDYNGWPGKTRDEAWATWNIVLWINNDEGLYHDHRHWMRGWNGRRGPFAADVEAYCREVFPNGTPDMEGEAEMSANWAYIAKSWREEK